jgi:RNA polymerase sigma factor (TIGR02999 family)
LVNEVYLRLAGPLRFANKAHFFKAAAEAMRRILIDHARAKGRIKRGGTDGAAMKRVPMSVLDLAASPESEDILAFDEAISRLDKETPLAASVVRLRFYAGLSIDETAEALAISPRSVDREWTYARAWLFQALEKEMKSE